MLVTLSPSSPRLRDVLRRLGVAPAAGVMSCLDAAGCDDGAFGDSTDDVRQLSSRALQLSAAAVPGALRFDSGGALALSSPRQTQMSFRRTPVQARRQLPLLQLSPEHAIVRGSAPHLAVAAAVFVSATTDAGKLAPANLAVEDAAVARAVDALLGAIPQSMLFYQRPSAMSFEVRMRTLRRHLLTMGKDSIAKGLQFIREWLVFCDNHSLPEFGLPVDDEMFASFLSEADERARIRWASSPSRTGAHVQHSLACAARWLTVHLRLPFHVSLSLAIRRAAPPNRERQPEWAQMWDVIILVHLARIIVFYSGVDARFVRPYAFSTFCVIAASLRLIEGLRSGPPSVVPVEDGIAFASVAALSKGRRKSPMRPLPWVVPCVSPAFDVTDKMFESACLDTLALFPAGACSMFPAVGSTGSPTSLAYASTWMQGRATPSLLATSISYLLQMAPLSLSVTDAREIVGRLHGPRHVLPELARVMMLPEAARYELGYWKRCGSHGRIASMPNRYSRDGERVLQIHLRSLILRWVRRRLTTFRSASLESFSASLSEAAEFEAAVDTMLTAAKSV
jgi:hypothetical protein